jgi:hypothetical protein
VASIGRQKAPPFTKALCISRDFQPLKNRLFMSFEDKKVYVVIANPNLKLGYIYEGNYYGTHYSDRGPIPLSKLEANGFSVEVDKIIRQKDNEVFIVNESSPEDLEELLNSKRLMKENT